MKVVVDAMCAQFGGIATYTVNLLATWPQLYPADELHVLLPDGPGSGGTGDGDGALDGDVRYPGVIAHPVAVSRPQLLGRPIAQTRHVTRVVREVGADAVLATLASTTVRHPGVPTVVVVYDLRHELRPAQFTRARRTMRRVSYGRGYAIADHVVSISRRSLDDLHRLHPRTSRVPSSVVHLGADHVGRWPARAGGGSGRAIAFGHHSNKNVDLVLDGWAALVAADPAAPVLEILGIAAERRPDIAGAIGARGLAGHVRLAPFLPAAAFEAAMASARLIVFPSDFEGFGLPVAEAMALGIPVVVGPEPAVLEVAGGHATVMDGWTPGALAAATRTALALPAADLRAAADYAARFTWAETTRRTRAALSSAAR